MLQTGSKSKSTPSLTIDIKFHETLQGNGQPTQSQNHKDLISGGNPKSSKEEDNFNNFMSWVKRNRRKAERFNKRIKSANIKEEQMIHIEKKRAQIISAEIKKIDPPRPVTAHSNPSLKPTLASKHSLQIIPEEKPNKQLSDDQLEKILKAKESEAEDLKRSIRQEFLSANTAHGKISYRLMMKMEKFFDHYKLKDPHELKKILNHLHYEKNPDDVVKPLLSQKRPSKEDPDFVTRDNFWKALFTKENMLYSLKSPKELHTTTQDDLFFSNDPEKVDVLVAETIQSKINSVKIINIKEKIKDFKEKIEKTKKNNFILTDEDINKDKNDTSQAQKEDTQDNTNTKINTSSQPKMIHDLHSQSSWSAVQTRVTEERVRELEEERERTERKNRACQQFKTVFGEIRNPQQYFQHKSAVKQLFNDYFPKNGITTQPAAIQNNPQLGQSRSTQRFKQTNENSAAPRRLIQTASMPIFSPKSKFQFKTPSPLEDLLSPTASEGIYQKVKFSTNLSEPFSGIPGNYQTINECLKTSEDSMVQSTNTQFLQFSPSGLPSPSVKNICAIPNQEHSQLEGDTYKYQLLSQQGQQQLGLVQPSDLSQESSVLNQDDTPSKKQKQPIHSASLMKQYNTFYQLSAVPYLSLVGETAAEQKQRYAEMLDDICKNPFGNIQDLNDIIQENKDKGKSIQKAVDKLNILGGNTSSSSTTKMINTSKKQNHLSSKTSNKLNTSHTHFKLSSSSRYCHENRVNSVPDSLLSSKQIVSNLLQGKNQDSKKTLTNEQIKYKKLEASYRSKENRTFINEADQSANQLLTARVSHRIKPFAGQKIQISQQTYLKSLESSLSHSAKQSFKHSVDMQTQAKKFSNIERRKSHSAVRKFKKFAEEKFVFQPMQEKYQVYIFPPYPKEIAAACEEQKKQKNEAMNLEEIMDEYVVE